MNRTRLSDLSLALALSLALLPRPTFAQPKPEPFGKEAGLAVPTDVPKLVALLGDTQAALAQKARACQQLSLVGNAQAVEALAALLPHPVLSAYARTGLEAIPDPAATEALRAALPKLQGAQLQGVVNSLGVRGDVRATEALVALSRDSARGAAAEALVALARIPSPLALQTIRQALSGGPSGLAAAAAEAGVVRAEREWAAGRRSEAAALFDAVRGAAAPGPLRHAAIRGSILARQGTPEAVALLLENLKSTDPAVVAVVAGTARELPGAGVGPALAAELPQAPAPLQVLLVRALGQRAQPVNPAPVEALASADSAELRLAALETLGAIGQSSSVPVLIQALAANRSPAEAEVAHASLVGLAATDTDTLLLRAVPGADPGTRVRLITILGHRGAAGATDELLRQAAGADPGVARAALDALAAVAGVADLPRLLPVALRVADGGVRDQAERSLYAVCLKQLDPAKRGEPLARHLREAGDPSARKSLLQVLAMLGDAEAGRAVAAACDDASPEVRDTALRLLSNWPDASPAPRLLAIYKDARDETRRLTALRGLVTLASLWTGEVPANASPRPAPPKASIDWLLEANGVVGQRVEEKRVLISGLGDLNCPEGLQLLRPYLEEPAVQSEACRATVRAAKGLVGKPELAQARPLLEKVVALTQDAELRQEARKLLERIPRQAP